MRFNEARANCAGNCGIEPSTILHFLASMRPAQIAREIEPAHPLLDPVLTASMRPAQIAREIHDGAPRRSRAGAASMRPAQIAREIVHPDGRTYGPTGRFNEARANCAGNFPPAHMDGRATAGFNEARANCAGNSARPAASATCRPRFNEARANCAGNSHQREYPYRSVLTASMRPAQIAREIQVCMLPLVAHARGFNEARANCAGNSRRRWRDGKRR